MGLISPGSGVRAPLGARFFLLPHPAPRVQSATAGVCQTVRADVSLRDSSSLEVEHRSYEPGVAGSIPAWSTCFFLYGKRAIFFHFLLACLVRPSVKPGTGSGSCSVTVITGDSESLNPGLIPGRTFFFPFDHQNQKSKTIFAPPPCNPP